MRLQNLLPNWILQFIQQPRTALSDIQAGLMMAVLVIPQSLGYAALAGLPPIMGLYAAITPVLVYAWIGASSVSSVGPVAITAIMTASALADYATGSLQYITLAITLSLMVGVILFIAGCLRLGWIMQFVSRGVAAGFISGAAVLIILGQIKHLLGIALTADSLINLAISIYTSNQITNVLTLSVGMTALILLIISRYAERWVWGWLPTSVRSFGNRFFIIALVIVSIILSHQYGLSARQVSVLQALPTELPTPSLPSLAPAVLLELLPSALLIALIAFVSSSTISAQQARLRGEIYSANRELSGLGLANITSSLFGGFAIAGGISRTSLNLLVGARTPLASVICALGVLLILLFFGKYLAGLPYAVLAAVIIISAIAMFDTKTLTQAWRQDRSDALCFIITAAAAIIFGLNSGLVVGLLASFAMMIYRTHQVHIAVLGRIGDSEHFRNIKRYRATTFDGLLLLRIDESLYFGNAQSVRDGLLTLIKNSRATDIVLTMTAVNHVDLAAQEMLFDLNQYCQAHGQKLHFAEVKGPVMDIVKSSPVFATLSGQIFLSTNQAVHTLTKIA